MFKFSTKQDAVAGSLSRGIVTFQTVNGSNAPNAEDFDYVLKAADGVVALAGLDSAHKSSLFEVDLIPSKIPGVFVGSLSVENKTGARGDEDIICCDNAYPLVSILDVASCEPDPKLSSSQKTELIQEINTF